MGARADQEGKRGGVLTKQLLSCSSIHSRAWNRCSLKFIFDISYNAVAVREKCGFEKP